MPNQNIGCFSHLESSCVSFLVNTCFLQRQSCFCFLSLQISSAYSKCSVEYTLVSFEVILTGQFTSFLLFIAKYYPIMCRCHTFSFLLLVDIWFRHFQFGSMVDRSALKILVQVFCWQVFSSLLNKCWFPTSNFWDLGLLHTFINTCYCQSF